MTWHTGEGGDFCLFTSVVLLFESGFILHYNWGLKIRWLWLMILVYEGSVALAVGGFVPHWLWGKLKILWRGAWCPRLGGVHGYFSRVYFDMGEVWVWRGKKHAPAQTSDIVVSTLLSFRVQFWWQMSTLVQGCSGSSPQELLKGFDKPLIQSHAAELSPFLHLWSSSQPSGRFVAKFLVTTMCLNVLPD